MTTGSLPRAASAEHLTDALRRYGTLGDGRVCNVVVGRAHATVLSRTLRLSLTYEAAAAGAPSSIILCASDDLAYMMAMHWYPDLRRRIERPLLDRYHAALVEHGVRGYDRRALDDDDRLSVLWQITTPVWQATNDIPPVVWWNNLERILLAVDDLGCRDLLL